MPRIIKSLVQMNADSLRYLADNTDITYLSEGSIARGLVEATNIEISRLGQYVASTYANSFINSAESYYLDQIGEGVGLLRNTASKAYATQEDQNVKFYIASGKLGEYFPDSGNLNNGLIPVGTTISTSDGEITYKTSSTVRFPYNAQEVFVPVISEYDGETSRVGRNTLVVHSGPQAVSVTNLSSIDNGGDNESDSLYRFRLSNHLAASPTANEASIKLTALSNPDVSRIVFKEFARGAGTFDALLVPVGNQLSRNTASFTESAIERVSAFGISSRIIEPSYIKFSMSIQLVPVDRSGSGALDVAKLSARNAILNYIDTIPMGGEMIVNRVRAAALDGAGTAIKDIKIIEMCFDNKPHSIRNYKLQSDELFTPSTTEQAIRVI